MRVALADGSRIERGDRLVRRDASAAPAAIALSRPGSPEFARISPVACPNVARAWNRIRTIESIVLPGATI
jgi:hypothetical protein